MKRIALRLRTEFLRITSDNPCSFGSIQIKILSVHFPFLSPHSLGWTDRQPILSTHQYHERRLVLGFRPSKAVRCFALLYSHKDCKLAKPRSLHSGTIPAVNYSAPEGSLHNRLNPCEATAKHGIIFENQYERR